MKRHLTQILVNKELITADQAREVERISESGGEPISRLLIDYEYVSAKDLLKCLSNQYGVPSVRLSEVDFDQEALRLLPIDLVRKHCVIPVNKTQNTIFLAMDDPSNIFAIDDVKFITGHNIEVIVALYHEIEKAIETQYGETQKVESFDPEEDGVGVAELEALASDAPVIRLTNSILLDAVRRGATHIYVETANEPVDRFVINYRLGDDVEEAMQPPLKLCAAVMARIKVLASMGLRRRAQPQEGVINLKLSATEVTSMEVTAYQTERGEALRIRLMNPPMRPEVAEVLRLKNLSCVEIASVLRFLAKQVETKLPKEPDLFKDGEDWSDE